MTISTVRTPRKTTTTENNFNWSEIRLKIIVVILVALSIGLGYFLGSIHSKKLFDNAAITSGNAQHNPITGNIEWKICK